MESNKENNTSISNGGVSIITVTNRPAFIENVLVNYFLQDIRHKELIVVLNGGGQCIEAWQARVGNKTDISIFEQPDEMTLGACQTDAVKRCAKYNTIAIFDDDDYYGPKYLNEAIELLETQDADVIGKATTYVYFQEKKILALRYPKQEYLHVDQVEGSTFVFKKEIFRKVEFPDITLGVDRLFCEQCAKEGIGIFSGSQYNHVYIRYGRKHKHAWGMSNKILLKQYEIIGKVDDYASYVSG